MTKQEAMTEFYKLTEKQQKQRKAKHYRGTCKCYTKPGEGINGTCESGKSCLVSFLPVELQRPN